MQTPHKSYNLIDVSIRCFFIYLFVYSNLLHISVSFHCQFCLGNEVLLKHSSRPYTVSIATYSDKRDDSSIWNEFRSAW